MKDAKKYAEILLERGVPYDEILAEPSLQNVTREQLRVWKSRLKNGATKPAETATKKADATQSATPATETQRGETTAETPPQPLENAPKRAVLVVFIKDALQNFHPADALYFLGVAICCNAVASALQGAGVFVAVIIGGVAFIALQGLKTEKTWRRRLKYALAFAGVELTAAISHIAWANEALWKNVGALPLDIWVNKYRNGVGEVVMLYGGSDVEKPFEIACGIAVVMFLSGVFVFFVSIQDRK